MVSFQLYIKLELGWSNWINYRSMILAMVLANIILNKKKLMSLSNTITETQGFCQPKLDYFVKIIKDLHVYVLF